MKPEGWYLITGFVAVVAIIIVIAISQHFTRRKKFVTSVVKKDVGGPNTLYLKGFHQQSAMSLGQWVFVAVDSKKIRVYAEFTTYGTSANYALFENKSEDVKNMTVTNISQNKTLVKFFSKVEYSLRLEMCNKNVSINDAIAMFNSFKK